MIPLYYVPIFSKNMISKLVIAMLVFSMIVVPTAARIWYVDDSEGPGIDFKSIQDAIDSARAGDIIIVYNGTYRENVKVSKQLNLIGINM